MTKFAASVSGRLESFCFSLAVGIAPHSVVECVLCWDITCSGVRRLCLLHTLRLLFQNVAIFGVMVLPTVQHTMMLIALVAVAFGLPGSLSCGLRLPVVVVLLGEEMSRVNLETKLMRAMEHVSRRR